VVIFRSYIFPEENATDYSPLEKPYHHTPTCKEDMVSTENIELFSVLYSAVCPLMYPLKKNYAS
jgi:hypothetical protein